MTDEPAMPRIIERRAFWVRGTVQGVGFRPFVHRLAQEFNLSGFVCNQAAAVYLEVEGLPEMIDHFCRMLAPNAPPLARIDSVDSQNLAVTGSKSFRIVASRKSDSSSTTTFVSPDIATCEDCLRELFDPCDRRYRYPFLNCTNCGPRLTIIQGAPYDRQNTTMSAFAMCHDCCREYEDPADRRFHAQPIACPACGPRLRLLTRTGQVIETDEPLDDFAKAIENGRIGAIKGLGGYHLVCDATNDSAVSLLRQRKHRDHKPFALMVGNLDIARRYCQIDAMEVELLQSIRRPIVLLKVRQDPAGQQVSQHVAPGSSMLGLMLPYTPVHSLLMEATNAKALVMTSGNQADEPIACDDHDAVIRLENLVDLLLVHDRAIHVRCDDSVTQVSNGHERLLRRSRGYAPNPVSLPSNLAIPTIAVGGHLKSTFCLGECNLAFLSHHLGDLDHVTARQAFERDIHLYEKLFKIHPKRIIHDLHPGYASTAYALQRSREQDLQLIAVQHHYAHIASGMAENQLMGPVIGVAFDGTGYGLDGTIWGGEFLIASLRGFRRAAHLRYVEVPGGDAAIREPWRCAVAHLMDADCESKPLQQQVGKLAYRTVQQMVARRFNSPMTSSMGRLFDAVAALAGGRTHVTYEGQAAVELEFLATDIQSDIVYPWDLDEYRDRTNHPCLSIDTRPLIKGIVADVLVGVERKVIARRFHSSVIQMIEVVCQKLRRDFGLDQVVLSGGVFMNSVLSEESFQRLTAEGFQVFQQHRIPCNDGGISLGQLAIAAAMDLIEGETHFSWRKIESPD